jgi:anti-sigma B factor antagonist
MSFAYPHFELTEQTSEDATHVITVRGEIHVSTAQEFARALEAAIAGDRAAVVLDLTGVEFIDSTGLSVLLNGLRGVLRRQGRLALAISNPTVMRLFEITRLDTTFDIEPTLQDALNLVRRPSRSA